MSVQQRQGRAPTPAATQESGQAKPAAEAVPPGAVEWADRVGAVSAVCYERPTGLDALLARPDGYVAWALKSDAGDADAAGTLEVALQKWFGAGT